MPFPRARSLSEFATAEVGDDVVLFDEQRMQYHELSWDAGAIWTRLDGLRSVEDVSAIVYGDQSSENVARVDHAVQLLAESGLLHGAGADRPSSLDRRTMTRLVVAGVAGVVGLPVVKSITVPDAASAETTFLPAGQSCGPQVNGVCAPGLCCCAAGQGYCYSPEVCTGAGYACM